MHGAFFIITVYTAKLLYMQDIAFYALLPFVTNAVQFMKVRKKKMLQPPSEIPLEMQGKY